MLHSKECFETSKNVPKGFVIPNSTKKAKESHINVKDIVLQNNLKNNFTISMLCKKCKNVPGIFFRWLQ